MEEQQNNGQQPITEKSAVNRLAAGLAVGTLGAFLSLLFTVWMLSTAAGQKLIMSWLELHPTVIQGIPQTTLDGVIFAFSNTFYGFIDGFILGYLGALFYGWFKTRLNSRRTRKQQARSAAE